MARREDLVASTLQAVYKKAAVRVSLILACLWGEDQGLDQGLSLSSCFVGAVA